MKRHVTGQSGTANRRKAKTRSRDASFRAIVVRLRVSFCEDFLETGESCGETATWQITKGRLLAKRICDYHKHVRAKDGWKAVTLK